ncbi:MAG: alpha/beta fold hydrolase [Anaerolineae bacterium]|jgi:haloalkane dehalogenase|nr:alpha/beta fold hydrolase [Anaerolineae bacterium]
MSEAIYPDWLDRRDYPFESHFYESPAGRMHYLDAGEKGTPIVFVHGNPSWSYEFRHMIRELSSEHRCIAPDHIGFGLSDKPTDWSYLPAEQADNLARLLDALDLEDITLVVSDWGGPLGLSYAIRRPERVKALVISNTWMWSVRDDWYYQAFSGFVGGAVGRWLIRRYHFFANAVVRSVFGDKRKLTPAVHRHYLMPLAVPAERKGNWTFPKEIVGSSEWLGELWQARGALADKKALIAWGMKDIAFREKELKRWAATFPDAKVIRFEDAGHYLAEEKPEELTVAIRELLGA